MSTAAHRRIEHGLLLVLLALIPLRAVIGETHTFETPKLLRGLTAPAAVSPATTFLIAAGIVASAGCAFSLRWWRGERVFRTGLEPGLCLLAAAALVACQRAGQKHLALIGAVDFFTIVLFAIALRQLMTSPWRVRVALAVVLATAGMLVAKACYQKWVEWPATVRYYEEHREQLLGQSNGGSNAAVASDAASAERRAGLIHDYEARLRSGAMSAYFAHPNILGSCLAMLALACAGIGLSRWWSGRRGAALAPVILTIACIAALLGTQSKGAVAACALGLILMVVAFIFGSPVCTFAQGRHRLAVLRSDRAAPRQAGRSLAIGWLAAILCAAGLLALLRAHPGALGLSMRYRSMYWQGAAAMAADAGWRGVGPDNFGRLFTRYKPVECPEEVDDPHNWLIKSFVEYGWLGAAGLIALLIGGSVRLAAPPTPCQSEGRREGQHVSERSRSVVFNLAAILLLFGGAWLVLIGSAPVDFTIVTLALGLAPFALFFVATAIEQLDSTAFDDAGLPKLAAGLGAGLVAFITHTFIDLALFTPGAATLFFAVGAVALAARDVGGAGHAGEGDGRDDRRAQVRALREAARRRRLALALAPTTFAVACLLGAVSYMCHRYAYFLEWGRHDAGGGVYGYREAIKYYELDGTAVEEMLDLRSPQIASRVDADEVLELTDELEQRDRFNAAVWHHRMAACYARFAIGGDLADLRAAVEMQRRGVEAYPTSPLRWLALGDLLERLAGQTRDAADRRAAADALQRALDLDAQRIYVSKPNRLSADLLQAIRERIGRLQ